MHSGHQCHLLCATISFCWRHNPLIRHPHKEIICTICHQPSIVSMRYQEMIYSVQFRPRLPFSYTPSCTKPAAIPLVAGFLRRKGDSNPRALHRGILTKISNSFKWLRNIKLYLISKTFTDKHKQNSSII